MKKKELKLFFEGTLALDDLHYLWPMVKKHFAQPDDYLWQEGEFGGHCGVIAKGQVKVVKETENPGHPLVLGVFGPGALIFDSSFLHEHPRSTSAIAMEEVEVLYLPRHAFEKTLAEHPALGHRLYRFILSSMAEQLRHANHRLTTLL